MHCNRVAANITGEDLVPAFLPAIGYVTKQNEYQ